MKWFVLSAGLNYSVKPAKISRINIFSLHNYATLLLFFFFREHYCLMKTFEEGDQ